MSWKLDDDNEATILLYVLDSDRKPVPATQQEWNDFPQSSRTVAKTELQGGRVVIETSFHGVVDDSEEIPMMFETTSTVGEDGHQEDCYGSWKDAEAGHREIVSRLEKLFAPVD